MANGESFKLKIGAIWITSDGLETGRRCKAQVAGADAILSAKIGNTTVSNSGEAFNESPLTTTGAGRVIEIVIAKLSTDLYESLKTIMDEAAETGGAVNITGEGEPGAFDVDIDVYYNPVYLSFGLFSAGNVRNVIIRGITRTINAL